MDNSQQRPQSFRSQRRAFVRTSLAVAGIGLLPVSQTGIAQEVYAPDNNRRASRESGRTRSPERGEALLLDGLAFKGPTGAMGMEAHHEEVIRFQDGQMSSSACERWGFEPGEYRVFQDGSRIRFEVTLISQQYGQIVWDGEIANQMVIANYHWQKKRLFWTLKNSYWFAGAHAG